MATRLQQLRAERGWSQTRLIVALEAKARLAGVDLPGRASMATQVSRWEQGAGMAARYRALFASVYEVDEDELIIPIPRSAGPTGAAAGQRVTPELVACFDSQLQAFCRTDNLVGPRQVLTAVTAEARQVESLLTNTPIALRPAVLGLVVRHAEFLGWLHQDAGDRSAAEFWTSRALEYSEELPDVHLRAYILMRKSSLATDAHEASRAVSLAHASLRDQAIEPRMRALGLRQLALASALIPDERGAAAAIEGSLASLDGSAFGTWPGYCTTSYLLSEGGICWLHLRRPERAIPALQDSLAGWPADFTRDRALATTRLARALVASNDIEQACTVGQQAVELAAATGSSRVARELRVLQQRLSPFARVSGVDQLRRSLVSLL